MIVWNICLSECWLLSYMLLFKIVICSLQPCLYLEWKGLNYIRRLHLICAWYTSVGLSISISSSNMQTFPLNLIKNSTVGDSNSLTLFFLNISLFLLSLAFTFRARVYLLDLLHVPFFGIVGQTGLCEYIK